jgi:hypothetical protein
LCLPHLLCLPLPGEQHVGNASLTEEVGPRTGGQSQRVLRRGKIDGVENQVTLERSADFLESRYAVRTKVNDFELPFGIDQNVVRLEVLMKDAVTKMLR